MSVSKHIRHILVAVLLLLPLSAVMAAPACKSGNLGCHMLRTAGHRLEAGLTAEQHRHQHDAILIQARLVSSVANLQVGHAGGGSGCLDGYPGFRASAMPLHNNSSTALRRWQLLSGVVRYALLEALYPVHGFW